MQRRAARQRRHIRQWRGIFNPQYLQCGTARQQDVRHSRAAPEFERAQRCAACQRNVRQFRAVRKSERVQCCAARQRDTSVTFKQNSSLSVCSVVQPTSADTSVTSSTRGLSAPASQRSSVPRSQARQSACACRAAASIAPALTLPMDSRSPGARPGSRAKRKAARAVRPEVAETARPRRVRRQGQNIRPTIVVVSPYPPARRYGIDAPAGPKLQGVTTGGDGIRSLGARSRAPRRLIVAQLFASRALRRGHGRPRAVNALSRDGRATDEPWWGGSLSTGARTGQEDGCLRCATERQRSSARKNARTAARCFCLA